MTVLTEQLSLLHGDEPDLEEERLLPLWFVRNVLGQEELDAYEYVFESPRTAGGVIVDAAFLSDPDDGDPDGTIINLVEVLRSNRSADLERRILTDLKILSGPLGGAGDDVLRQLVSSLRLTTRRKIVPSRTTVVLHVVAPRLNTSLDVKEPVGFEVHVYGKTRLEQVARAVSSPSAYQGSISVTAQAQEILETTVNSGRVFACPVPVADIVKWPGIEDRTLFDLNVRLKLGGRRVRLSLEAALREDKDAGDFLASHNGLTVVCDRVDRAGLGLAVTNFSVVNGTQSVIAFYEARSRLSPELRVLVKFAEVGTTKPIAREIAIRSNTQNPVNSRNLRALDARQLTIRDEFYAEYPDYIYEIRPDVAPILTDQRSIQNDDAAQLLCAIYNQKPWLAVKRLSLFEQPTYGQIFHPRIHAAHVLLSYLIYMAVQDGKSAFPKLYQKAWKLTSIVATYMISQILRSDDELARILEHPEEFVSKPNSLPLRELVAGAAAVLQLRATDYSNSASDDDFKVDFKREDALRSLASEARRLGLSTKPSSGN
jgi:AIPR protein